MEIIESQINDTSRRKYTKKLLVFSSLVLVVFSVSALNGANGAGISVSPLTFELSANPGDSISNIVKVFNTTNEQLLVNMEVENFAPSGEEGRVALETGETSAFSLARWVTVEPASLLIQPNEFLPVEFTVNVPFNAEPGGHYASILASVGGQAPAGGGAAVVQKVGALVLMQVSGDVAEELSVLSMTAPSFSEYSPVIITTRFENTGTVHLKPRGFIRVTNFLGREVAKIELSQKNVLPNSVRKVEEEFNGRFLFGKYTATVTAIYGSKNQPLTYTTSFWVIPWKITSVVGTVVFVTLLILFIARRRIFLSFRILFRGK